MTTPQRPTRRQVEVLRACIRAGSVAAAAYDLGISQTTARQHLSGLYRRTGCLNAAQAAYWLGSSRIGTLLRPGGTDPHPAGALASSVSTSVRDAETRAITESPAP